MVQCARIAFGLSGIYEPDEASKIHMSANKNERSIGKKKRIQPLGSNALSKILEKDNFQEVS
jgi:hypothetical protein